jgi:hypothetical protein
VSPKGFGIALFCRYHFLELTQLLLDKGANPLLLDCHGNTALDVAESDAPVGSDPIIGPLLRARTAQPYREETVELLKQHTARYEVLLEGSRHKG